VRWTALTLNKRSPVPLYYQLAELVKEHIRLGELQPGEQLPAAHALGEQVGISRMTARQAISLLVREGTLVVRHGAGTFVAEPKLTYDALHLLGFTAELMRRGGMVGSRVLEQVLVRPPLRIAGELRLEPCQEVVKIVRLRLSGDTPLLLETSFIPAHFYPGLEHEDLVSRSLYGLLEQAAGGCLDWARQTLEAIIANEYESNLFGVALGTPMILLEGVTYLDRGPPTEYFKAIYRGDRFKFAMESRRHRVDEMVIEPRVSVVLA